MAGKEFLEAIKQMEISPKAEEPGGPLWLREITLPHKKEKEKIERNKF